MSLSNGASALLQTAGTHVKSLGSRERARV